MGIFLDVFIIAIMILSVFLGYKKGFIGVIYNLCAFFVAIIITWFLYEPITKVVIENTQFDESIKSIIIEKSLINNSNEEKEVSKTKKTKDKKDDMKDLNEKNTEYNINNYLEKYIKTPIKNGANDAITETAGVISEKMIGIGVGIALFIVIRIVLIFLKFIAEGLASLPIIKQFNEVGGIAYGIIRGGFVIYLLLAILFFIISINSTGMIANVINSSILSKYLYANNLILHILF